MKIQTKLVLVSLCLLLSSCYYDTKEELYQFIQPVECDVTTAAYAADIIPIMEQHCYRCHRDERQDGNVNLQGYNNIKIYVDDGSLFGTTNHEAGYPVMPTNGIKIPACQIEVLRLWIDQGANND